MAQCLRHLTNRLTSISNVINHSRNFIIDSDKSVVKLQPKLRASEPYSTQIKPVVQQHGEDLTTCPDDISDNRESKNDIVTKENLLLTNNRLQLLQGSQISFIRYSSAKSDDCTLLYSDTKEDYSNKPSPEKLSRVYDVLRTTLPELFTRSMDYSIYHPEIIFENNIRGETTVGLYNYVKTIAMLRTVGHLRFAFVAFELLKITKHPEDSTIKARWRIKGVSAYEVMVNFWRYRIWKYKEMYEKSEAWYDGFSTFYVNSEGKIYKHVADKMMPDQDTATDGPTTSPMGAAKLAVVTCLIPRVTDICSFT